MVTEPVNEPVKESPPLTVFYDGACPLCRRQIGIYRSLKPLQSEYPLPEDNSRGHRGLGRAPATPVQRADASQRTMTSL